MSPPDDDIGRPEPARVNPPNTADAAGVARADAVAALARQVHDLGRAVRGLEALPGRVEEIATDGAEVRRLVTELSEVVAALTRRPKAVPAPSWLLLPDDPAVVGRVLGELFAWLHAIFLRYPDGAAALPECWMRHPDVVEELVWLMHAWCAAYQGKAAAVQLAGDWHDRQRPGVVRRIGRSAGSCSVEKHLTRPEWDQYPTGAPAVPGIDDAAVIAQWWGTGRDDPAPEPTPHGVAHASNGALR